jgi:molybdate transport system regulatory protein
VHADRQKGTRLTRQGKELLEKYKQLEVKCMAADDKIFSKIFK